ncbi:MAG: VWA domain-containing protein [Saprospiraceae bacterium]|nr:VWA domain-containing protein [Saprospiraceae bacterium]
MFRFENPEMLWLLAIIPVIWLVDLLVLPSWGQSRSSLGESGIISRLIEGRSRRRAVLKMILYSIGLIFLIIGLSNPQWGTKREKVTSKGSDIIIALDISRSMLCEDMAPNRLERAKRFVERLIDRLKGERIGIILFAGNAYLQMPLTTDYGAASLFVKSASTSMAATQGTAIGDAIELAQKVFGDEEDYHKALIVITDGETHDEGALEVAGEAGKNDMIIFLVGVGTNEGGYIPVNINGRQDYLRDNSGNFVKTKMNAGVMQELAEAGGGAYFNVVGRDQILDELDDRIDQLEKRQLEQRSFEEYESYFQFFLIPGMIFLLINFFIYERKQNTI